MQDEARHEFSAEDLSLVADPDDGQQASTETTEKPAEKPASDKTEAKPEAEAKAPKETSEKAGQIATGADVEEEDKAKEAKDDKVAKDKAADAQKWREEIAEHYAAGDNKLYKKELKRLEGITDVKSIWGMYRELESKFHGGGLVKIPGKDAKPEDIAAFHKAMGVPEKAEDYFNGIKLENGAVIGEEDKPVVQSFGEAVHKAGATPEFVNAAMNWYYGRLEDIAAETDEADDTFRREATQELKDEYGASYKRMTNAIGPLFATAKGGANLDNAGALYTRLMGGRTADGKIIGNDPDMVRWLVGLAQEVNPAATVVEDGGDTTQSVSDEIASIEKFMKENKRAYFKDEAKQARYRELLSAREKIQAKAR